MVHEQSWSTPRLLQHPREHLAGQQTHIVGQHAEDELVDEVSDRLGMLLDRAPAVGLPAARSWVGRWC